MTTLLRCALCGEESRLLQSHVRLPKFVYKRLRNRSAPNPNPVMLSAAGITQTSRQQTQTLLCAVCENARFSELGEKWVARSCLQDDGSFPLRDELFKSQHGPQLVMPGAGAFYASKASSILSEKIEYFAASMVWRGQHLSGGGYSLGPYDEEFRRYLLQQAAFPVGASLFVFIRYRSNITQTSHGVLRKRGSMATNYSFSIPGLTFHLNVGKHRDPRLRQACFHENALRPILDFDEIEVITDARLRAVLEAAASAGKRSRLSSRP